jgi:hypothetical protein
MFDRETRKHERDRNREVLKDSINIRDEIVTRKTDKIRKQYEQIEAEIKALQEDKQRFFEMPITKEELLKNAKDQLRQHREFFIERLISDHLKACQERNSVPFATTNMKVHLMNADNAWKLFYFAVSEKDIERAVGLLPEIGTSAAEREGEIKKINEKIAKLQKSLKEDLEAEKQKR